jgi:hypothetical protein
VARAGNCLGREAISVGEMTSPVSKAIKKMKRMAKGWSLTLGPTPTVVETTLE